ncbi:hypothetical protein ABMA28_017236 [Loxostege sticticalis]|uniref:Phosphoserine phosphatase n=1 Tax=Loxostege sticticalis TaxID=481309 RepID=A0ABD0S293_LOXSC
MALYSIKNNLQYATLKTLSLVSISVMSPQQSVQELFRTADCVCFDVDSTVIRDEGIDELANFCGKGDEVKRLTAEAMGGSMTFQEALKKRLDIIRPSVSQIREYLEKFPVHLTPGVSQLVKELHERGVAVYLVSGGFRVSSNQLRGKGLVIRRLNEQHGYQRLIVIGDGATDAEACPPADRFIGEFEVKKRASWYVTDFQDLIQTLAIQAK